MQRPSPRRTNEGRKRCFVCQTYVRIPTSGVSENIWGPLHLSGEWPDQFEVSIKFIYRFIGTYLVTDRLFIIVDRNSAISRQPSHRSQMTNSNTYSMIDKADENSSLVAHQRATHDLSSTSYPESSSHRRMSECNITLVIFPIRPSTLLYLLKCTSQKNVLSFFKNVEHIFLYPPLLSVPTRLGLSNHETQSQKWLSNMR
ncbi:hypothetical protein GGS21DRAFT_514071 [Xylaria nigripes]|nr:hypothetical protein GGS21DRAFT_514071 [Xylaria nigripes]